MVQADPTMPVFEIDIFKVYHAKTHKEGSVFNKFSFFTFDGALINLIKQGKVFCNKEMTMFSCKRDEANTHKMLSYLENSAIKFKDKSMCETTYRVLNGDSPTVDL